MNPLTDPESGPPAGNPDGTCAIPAEAGPEDTSSPDNVVGTGTPESCTEAALDAALVGGGLVTFDCGSESVTITLSAEKVLTQEMGETTVDGGGLVTLSGEKESKQVLTVSVDP